jgi:hypothetical protein
MARDRMATKNITTTPEHKYNKILLLVTLVLYGCKTAMYLSIVNADNVKIDTPIGKTDDLYARVATKQFDIFRIPVTKKIRNKGIPKTPTAKSVTDCKIIIK